MLTKIEHMCYNKLLTGLLRCEAGQLERDTKTMTTAVVVTTVVTTNVSENEFKLRALDQIRHNDRSLLDSLQMAGIDARVVTAIMDVEEFMDYVRERDDRNRQNSVPIDANGDGRNGAVQNGAVNGNGAQPHPTETASDPAAPYKTTVVTDEMSEADFMNHTLQQLRNGHQRSLVEASDDALCEMEDEEIGEHFSRYPFQY